MPTDTPHEDDSPEELDAERLEEHWKHALERAESAVGASTRSNVLRPAEAAAAGEQIRKDRTWLSRFSPTLHKLFPARRRPPGPS